MKRMIIVLIALAMVASVLAAAASRPVDDAARAIDVGKLPDGYRD